MSATPQPERTARGAVEPYRHAFARTRALAERALEQLGDEDFFRAPDAATNSPAVLVKHLAGNLRSRFTDFLTSDGEKPDRDRDGEFEVVPPPSPEERRALRERLRARWDEGWALLDAALDGLADADLERTVTIRGEPHRVREALLRQVGHYGYHTGQIVLIARLARGAAWRCLSIERGASERFDAAAAPWLAPPGTSSA